MNVNDLPMVLEKARIQTIQAVNEIQQENELPAFLYEGVLCSVLAEIRNMKISELNLSQTDHAKEESE